MDPKDISIESFDYELPEDKIAFYPLEQRDASKLLVYRGGSIITDRFSQLPDYLSSDSVIVFNDTRVLQARIKFQKISGASIEIFCLEPASNHIDITQAMQQTQSVLWRCMVGGASKWKHGQDLQKKSYNGNQTVTLSAKFVKKLPDCIVIAFAWSPGGLCFAEIIRLFGTTPLPPYIKRPAENSDNQRYQTIYAAREGSVAAPTAGLHFTTAVMNRLREKAIHPLFVTLHVGAATFKPVKSVLLAHHAMHAEWIAVERSTLRELIQYADKQVTAVGTTSLRTLESLYWLGVKITMIPQREPDGLALGQWEAFELSKQTVPALEALGALESWMEGHHLDRLLVKTQLLIAPPYRCRIAGSLVTNLHQPKSTLLLLVAAFTRGRWRQVYDYALGENFRFLSYGDACLLFVE